MLKVDNKKEQIEIVGDSELLKDEIGTLMLALCGELAKASKSAAEDMYDHIVQTVALTAIFLEAKCGVKLSRFRKDHDAKKIGKMFSELAKYAKGDE